MKLCFLAEINFYQKALDQSAIALPPLRAEAPSAITRFGSFFNLILRKWGLTSHCVCAHGSPATATVEPYLTEGLRVIISVQRIGGTGRRPRQSCCREPPYKSSATPRRARPSKSHCSFESLVTLAPPFASQHLFFFWTYSSITNTYSRWIFGFQWNLSILMADFKMETCNEQGTCKAFYFPTIICQSNSYFGNYCFEN